MSLLNVKIGDKAPEVVNAIIEIPKGSQNKYEVDKETGTVWLDRVLFSPVHYPVEYGYLPETLSEDGDPIDILLMGSNPLIPGCVAKVRPVGLMKMLDNGEQDNKILAVPKDNPRFNGVKDLQDVEPHFLKEIAHFFSTMKELEGKKVEVQGWEDAEAAKAEIQRAQEMYKNK